MHEEGTVCNRGIEHHYMCSYAVVLYLITQDLISLHKQIV